MNKPRKKTRPQPVQRRSKHAQKRRTELLTREGIAKARAIGILISQAARDAFEVFGNRMEDMVSAHEVALGSGTDTCGCDPYCFCGKHYDEAHREYEKRKFEADRQREWAAWREWDQQ